MTAFFVSQTVTCRVYLSCQGCVCEAIWISYMSCSDHDEVSRGCGMHAYRPSLQTDFFAA